MQGCCPCVKSTGIFNELILLVILQGLASSPDATLSPIIQEFWTGPAVQLAKLAYAESNQALEKLG